MINFRFFAIKLTPWNIRYCLMLENYILQKKKLTKNLKKLNIFFQISLIILMWHAKKLGYTVYCFHKLSPQIALQQYAYYNGHLCRNHKYWCTNQKSSYFFLVTSALVTKECKSLQCRTVTQAKEQINAAKRRETKHSHSNSQQKNATKFICLEYWNKYSDSV